MRNDKFPWHAAVTESLELDLFVDTDFMAQFSEAFTVHPPDEFPMMLQTEDIFEFTGGRKLEVLIAPSVIRSDKSLKALAPSDRSCYFEGERKLNYFKVYTKQNCKIECFSNFVQKICNCVPFDVVRELETKVCGIAAESRDCLLDMEMDFRDYGPTGKLASCSCLSLCDSVSYDIEIRESKLQGNE